MSADPSPLTEIGHWGAPHAAAAVLDRTGVLATHGDVDREFRIASVTKLATAYALLVAVEEGTIALTDALGPPGSTVRHLMCHAGGLDFDSERVLAPPAARRIYSNSGYEQLAERLAERSGMAFGDYLLDAVLSPLSMDASQLRGSAAKDLFTTVADLCRFAGELLNPTLIDPSTWAAALEPQFPQLSGVLPGWGRYDPNPWGLGPELHGHKQPHWTGALATAQTYGHFGGSGTFVWIDPDLGLACVVLTDREFDDWAVAAWPGFSDRVRLHYSTV